MKCLAVSEMITSSTGPVFVAAFCFHLAGDDHLDFSSYSQVLIFSPVNPKDPCRNNIINMEHQEAFQFILLVVKKETLFLLTLNHSQIF